MSDKRIYLDYAATTPIDPEIFEAMKPYFSEKYGNASSTHSMGLEAKQKIDQCRDTIAKYLNCRSDEIIFTSGGTESNNLAILGAARANKRKGNHIITSEIEHSSVLNVCKYLERKEGFKVTYLKVDTDGFVDLDQLEKEISKDTILVSIIYANNEIGTIQPVKEISQICKKNKTLFHVDACQATGALSLDTKELGVDLMTLNSSKIYGPKGVGLLFAQQNAEIEPIMFGGNQEFNLRSGTHNTHGIVGMTEALKKAQENREQESKRLTELRDFLIAEVLEKFPQCKLNGSQENRLPNNINISFPKVDGRELLLQLDNFGIYVSAGSACSAGNSATSHVLTAIGEKDTSLRITLGKYTTKEDLEYVLEKLSEIIT